MRPFWRKFRKFPFLGGGLDAQQLRSMAGSDMFRVERQEDWRLLHVSKTAGTYDTYMSNLEYLKQTDQDSPEGAGEGLGHLALEHVTM